MLTLSTAAAMLDTRFAGVDADVCRVVTDSRSIEPGDLFVALRGAKFDGGAYAAQALAAGAAGVVLDATQAPEIETALRVADTRLALGQLAARWRARFALPLIAVTGSNGKTTVKEMLAAILAAAAGSRDAVLATAGNFNNDIGLPLMLLRLNADHRYAVLEMGMNHAGEIDYLTRLAQPDVALVNNAQAAHVGFLGSVEAIARAKGEIFNGLADSGVAVINADDAYAPLWREANRQRRVIGFGRSADAELRGEFVADGDGTRVTVSGVATLTFHLTIPGEHNAMNALAATAAATALGIAPEHIGSALGGFSGVKGRLQTRRALHGSTFIDDSYNANPDSVAAAIKVLAARSGKTILVLGDMGELGSEVVAHHAQAGLAARQAGIGRLLALGEQTRASVRAFGAGAMHFERIEELLAELENALDADTTVLVKGSRFMQMERVVQSFREDA